MNTFEFFQCSKKWCSSSSMSGLVNVVKALLGLKFDVWSFEAKNRVFEFDHQQMNTFEFVRCSKNDVRVRSMFDKMVFDPSLLLRHIVTILDFRVNFYNCGHSIFSMWCIDWQKLTLTQNYDFPISTWCIMCIQTSSVFVKSIFQLTKYT